MAIVQYYIGSHGPYFVDDTSDAFISEEQVVRRAELTPVSQEIEDHLDIINGNPHGTDFVQLGDVTVDVSDPADPKVTLDVATRDLHIDCGTAKTLVLAKPVWVDIDFPIIARSAAANNPTPATLIGNLTAPRWAVNDYLMCEGQEMIHLWKEGSTCYWHIHLITNGSEAVDKYVKMEIEYTWATLNGQLQAVTTTASSDLLIPANTPDRTHLIYPIASFTPSAAKIGTQVYARLKRVAATGTAPAADPFIPMLQMHIEVNTLGSRQLGLK